MKQIKEVLQIKEYTLSNVSKNNQFRHSKLLPNNILAMICGPSMCGKTSILHSLLLSKHGLKLQQLHVFSTTLYQPVYEILKRAIEENRINGINQYFHCYSNEDDVISVEDAPPHSIMVFDDIASEKTNKMADYYSRGRHKNIDSFYLCQTYSKIPKQRFLRITLMFTFIFTIMISLFSYYYIFDING